MTSLLKEGCQESEISQISPLIHVLIPLVFLSYPVRVWRGAVSGLFFVFPLCHVTQTGNSLCPTRIAPFSSDFLRGSSTGGGLLTDKTTNTNEEKGKCHGQSLNTISIGSRLLHRNSNNCSGWKCLRCPTRFKISTRHFRASRSLLLVLRIERRLNLSQT